MKRETLKPLPVKIPRDYADLLGCHRDHISHINAGERRISFDQACLIMEVAPDDPRLAGLHLFHLWPEMVRVKPSWLIVEDCHCVEQ